MFDVYKQVQILSQSKCWQI